ncbi:MAG: tripartite tricarboxylate transporter TctB family protein [Burkholderiaceae bacterium]
MPESSNRELPVAGVLLLVCAAFIGASFEIESSSFGQMSSALWPRLILGLLTLLCLLYFGQSLRDARKARGNGRPAGLRGWVASYRNALWCYALFFGFLVSLPLLGMLIGGVLFVFGMLTVLGGGGAAALLRHAAIALVCVGLMWMIFTFGLHVILPPGMILSAL